MRFEGWRVTGWIVAAVVAVSLLIIGIFGWHAEGMRSVVRLTGRTSITLFVAAFTASSLCRRWPGQFTRWLLRNRRFVGVGFAGSHAVHLAALVIVSSVFPDPLFQEAGRLVVTLGGIAYLVIAVMALTSSDRAQAWLGTRRWQALHRIGGWYIWLIFLHTYATRAVSDPRDLVPVALLLLAAALRVAPSSRQQAVPGK